MRKFLRLFPALLLAGSISTWLQAQDSTFYEENIPTVDKPMVDCRETNNINVGEVADAYPFLSADGLRLYFTSNREGGHGRFFLSQRNSVKEPFREPGVLGSQLTDGYYAGTLTADERTLCMVKNGDMYLSFRKDWKTEFSTPVLIKGQSNHYHFGPAISPDGNEIIVTVTVDGNDVMKRYRRIDDIEYREVDILPAPAGNEPGPGQFSKDGLSYYFSLEEEGKQEAIIWRYTRPTIRDAFVDLEKLPVSINKLIRNFQPSVNGDASIIVFVTSQNDAWEEDDIVLVNDPEKSLKAEEFYAKVVDNKSGLTVMNKVVTPEVKAYPNPFHNNIILEMDPAQVEGTVFSLYDLSGRLILSQRIATPRTDIRLNNLAGGTYVYQVVNSRKKMVSSGKLVRQ